MSAPNSATQPTKAFAESAAQAQPKAPPPDRKAQALDYASALATIRSVVNPTKATTAGELVDDATVIESYLKGSS